MKHHLLILLTFITFCSFGQEHAFYYFQNGLEESQHKYPALSILGSNGTFIDEVVDKFGQEPRKVYVLPANSGLNFDNTQTKNFINGSFALEMYFKYDDGDMMLYNQLMGDALKSKQGKYVHLVTTRDATTKKVNVFVDGKLQFSFTDTENSLDIDNKSNVMFFYSPGQNTSSGAVAMIKIYNYFIDKPDAQELFKAFSSEKAQVSDLNLGILNNLYFVRSEAVFLPESMPELENVYLFMRKNPKAKILLSGHTDNVGDFNLNLRLSKERAEAVKKYLITKGIDQGRIETKGFGALKPITDNNTEASRAKNRRVVMKIL